MNMTEKNGQPSMEEILASIRRIIAEEPTSHPHNGELRGTPIMLKGDSALDEPGEFDLPAIFRSSPPAAVERQTPLLGRLTDAIRHATTAQPEPQAANSDAYLAVEAAEAVAAGGGEPVSSGLSSLKPIRPETRAEPAPPDPVRPFNGSGPGHEPSPSPAQTGAFAAKASAGPDGEPKRVMVPFKDTHFLKMSAPVSAPAAPSVAPVAPPPAAPATAAPPLVEPTPPPDFAAIIPSQLDRPSLVNPQPSAPQVPPVAVPPPPLPTAAPAAVPQHHPVVAAPPTGVEATGTIEDTTADLLRPMLRQWLADNMPRMVEKALHIEIAESIKAPKKP